MGRQANALDGRPILRDVDFRSYDDHRFLDQFGPEAFELIGEAVTAMEAEATVETMMATIHAHPTIYEALGEAFNNVYGLAINV